MLCDKKLAIYGSGGLGKEIYDIAKRVRQKDNVWTDIVFIDDFAAEGVVDGVQYLHLDSICSRKDEYTAVVAVGEPKVRELLYNRLKENNIPISTIIDPSVIIGNNVNIGEGTIICEFVSIHRDVSIGKNCLLQPYSLLGHDIKVGNHSVLSPKFAPGGKTVIGDRVYIGMSSTIKEGITIEDDAVISIGSVVLKDVAKDMLVFGNPARQTLKSNDGKIFR